MLKSNPINTVIAPPQKPYGKFTSLDQISNYLTKQVDINYLMWERSGGYTGVSPQININSASNIDNNITDLLQYRLNAGSLGHDASIVTVTAFGTLASNVNNKRIILYFGSSILIDTGTVAANSGSWIIESKIVRVSVNSQKVITTIISENTLITNRSSYVVTPENLDTVLVIKCTGTGMSSGDITQESLLLQIISS